VCLSRTDITVLNNSLSSFDNWAFKKVLSGKSNIIIHHLRHHVRFNV